MFMQDIKKVKILKNQSSITHFNGRIIISNTEMMRLQSKRAVDEDNNIVSIPYHQKLVETEESKNDEQRGELENPKTIAFK